MWKTKFAYLSRYFWIHCWDILCESQHDLILYFLHSNIRFGWKSPRKRFSIILLALKCCNTADQSCLEVQQWIVGSIWMKLVNIEGFIQKLFEHKVDWKLAEAYIIPYLSCFVSTNQYVFVCLQMFMKLIICIGLSLIPPELPDTSFTRSISNPEAVMRRRRQQKLEKKLQQYRSKVSCFVFCLCCCCCYRRFCSCCFYTVPKYWFVQDGAPDTGGTLKIYGEALRKEVGL